MKNSELLKKVAIIFIFIFVCQFLMSFALQPSDSKEIIENQETSDLPLNSTTSGLTLTNNDPDNEVSFQLEQISGHYKGFDSFDLEQINTIPSNWENDYANHAEKSYTLVKNELLEHKKIVQLFDDSTSFQTELEYNFDSAQSTDTIEFYALAEQTDEYLTISTYDSATMGLSLRFYNDGTIRYYSSSSWNTIASETYTADTWNHFKIDFDCSYDAFNITINFNSVYYLLPFENTITDVDSFTIQTETTETGSFYIDAFD